MNILFDKIVGTSKVHKMYLVSNVTRTKSIWKNFMAMVLGGPDEYSRFSEEEKIKINSKNNDFDIFCELLDETMNKMCVKSQMINEIMKMFQERFNSFIIIIFN